MGGAGGGIVWSHDEFDRKVSRGLELSPVHEVLIEECLYGWKEYELELLRDSAENVIIVCSIENLDPMGVHTGDSVTVAPQQTLTDKQFQQMRDAAIKAMRSIGTFAGGCNIQFAFHPQTGRMVVIEINPRVSRSSALASKATGYPIAKVAARLAVGYTLDELPNEVTGTSACFEPAIDYVVTKVPRFNFEKFEGVDEELTTQMKAVGEVMAIGRTFTESLQKAWQSLELGYAGLGADRDADSRATVRERLSKSYWDRTLQIRSAFTHGASVEEIADITKVDPWFLYQIRGLVEIERDTRRAPAPRDRPRPDAAGEAARLLGPADRLPRAERRQRSPTCAPTGKSLGLKPTFRLVDTCAGEFEAQTPYFYSTYDLGENESPVSENEKILILGSGPNRIGQGIEFDYSCVHGVLATKEMGYEAIMINCNPETVSTDFDVADKLYFEPVYWERVFDVIEHEQPTGCIVQLGGQTAIKLADDIERRGIRIFGTQYCEDGPRRGPGQVLRDPQGAGDPVAALRHGAQRVRGRGRRRRDRLPDPDPAELRPRRAGDADRHQQRGGGRVRREHPPHDAGQRDPPRPLPRKRDRSRLRLHLRRRRARSLRHPPAHRTRRRPLRRLDGGAPAVLALRNGAGRRSAATPRTSRDGSKCAGSSTCSTPSKTRRCT